MTQDERWQARYDQVLAFMEGNHRRPSKHRLEDHLLLNWFRRNEKMYNHGMLSAERREKFKALMIIADKYRRVNQYS